MDGDFLGENVKKVDDVIEPLRRFYV